jgi:hypothetical protein
LLGILAAKTRNRFRSDFRFNEYILMRLSPPCFSASVATSRIARDAEAPPSAWLNTDTAGNASRTIATTVVVVVAPKDKRST